MLQINKQVDYGLQLLLALEALPSGGTLSLRAFADERNISFLFLQRIASRLKQANIVCATKGSKGGYFLCQKASDIRFKDIIEAIEGPYGPVACMQDGKTCPNEAHCASKNVFSRIQQDIITSMNKYTLADMKVVSNIR